MVKITTFKKESGFGTTQELLSLDNPPTAIFATNNVLGEAAIFGFRQRGLQTPEDMSMIQFDDVPWACLTKPSLSVVAQPTYDIGFTGFQRLAQRLKNPDENQASLKTVLQPQLILRESCAPCCKGLSDDH